MACMQAIQSALCCGGACSSICAGHVPAALTFAAFAPSIPPGVKRVSTLQQCKQQQ